MRRFTRVVGCGAIVAAVLTAPVQGDTELINPVDNATVRTNGSWFAPDGTTDIDTSESDRIDVDIIISYDDPLFPDVNVTKGVDIDNYSWEVSNPPGLPEIASDEPANNGTWQTFLIVDQIGEDFHGGVLAEDWL